MSGTEPWSHALSPLQRGVSTEDAVLAPGASALPGNMPEVPILRLQPRLHRLRQRLWSQTLTPLFPEVLKVTPVLVSFRITDSFSGLKL